MTVLLAIIIFAPACVLTSKLFRLSSQAQDNFVNFVKEINDLGANGKDGQKKSVILILDQGTYIMNLWSNYLDEYIRCPGTEIEEHYLGPGKKCNGKDCICLVKTFEVKEGIGLGGACGGETAFEIELPKGTYSSNEKMRSINQIIPKDFNCIEIPDDYYVYGVDWKNWVRFSNNDPRRLVITLTKNKNIIFACQNNCELPASPEKHPTKSTK
ncbi:hypothetical protein HZC32_02830 [Candidatus Woesearchaeota archaeon]|nr:hypothetical protein [Candidatus Woesearchaeota archaeon]